MGSELHALEMWRHALAASVRSDAPDLSSRQMALLLSVYLGAGPHTVRGLAKDLNISKPAVSRALDRLGELGYIRRERDALDRRNVLVQKTEEGGIFLKSFSKLIVDAEEALAKATPREVPAFLALAETCAAAQEAVPEAETLADETSWIDVAA